MGYRGVPSLHFQCFLGLTRYPGLLLMASSGDALITRGRAMIASHFIRNTDAQVLVTIDADIVFRPEDVLKIAQEAEHKDIVTGMYICRSKETTKPASIIEAPITFRNDELPVEIRWGATGFMAVNRRVFEFLKDDLPLCHPNDFNFWPFYDPLYVDEADTGQTIYLSEDYAFCERARRAGFKVWVDPTVRLVHLGEYGYRLEDMLQKAPADFACITLDRDGMSYTAEGHLAQVAG